jgi:hypothetical protein
MRECNYKYEYGFTFLQAICHRRAKMAAILSSADDQPIHMQMHRRFQRTVLRKKYSIL